MKLVILVVIITVTIAVITNLWRGIFRKFVDIRRGIRHRILESREEAMRIDRHDVIVLILHQASK